MLSYINGDTEIQRGDGLNLRFSLTPSEQRCVKLIWPWREERVSNPSRFPTRFCLFPNRGPILSSELALLPKQTQSSKSSQEVPGRAESLREKERASCPRAIWRSPVQQGRAVGREEPAGKGASNLAFLERVASSSTTLSPRSHNKGNKQALIYHLTCYQPRAEPWWEKNVVTTHSTMRSFPLRLKGQHPRQGQSPAPFSLLRLSVNQEKESEWTF